MERKDTAKLNAANLLDRASGRRADRRRFLTGAGKYGALLLGAKYAGDAVSAQDAAPEPVDGQMPVAEKGVVRVLGLAQRRPGLTRAEAPFADTPHIVPSYYAKVYQDITKKPAGRVHQTIVAMVTDGAFGGERNPERRPYDLRKTVPPVTLPCTSLVNRDMVSECTYEAVAAPRTEAVAAPGTEGRGAFAPNQPRWVEDGSEMNLVVQQVFAHGTRPSPIQNDKAMYFIKFAPSVTDWQKTWQTLHDRALKEFAAFGEGLRGYELVQRLPNVAPRQPNKCGSEMILPDVVAMYWREDGVKNFSDYAKAFRRADTENAIDLWNTFFLLVDERMAME